ncbi:Pyrimidine pathway regulatory protein 1 [Pseudocercospora fuligena]|uniref:Pyrimidine pathway regulatory protein 1 n=1 Tax=Pseudocercospora fuligena TaxID=685502 RepID=A0A8H6R7F2_9PEZI|nr:Pyrimidine pathway regulatory protein 1 [Pseudocercospora fuligena]
MGEPKYLGPSSVVSFARLIYAAVPQSQGLPVAATGSLPHAAPEETVVKEELTKLPEEAEGIYFLNAYFDVWHHSYPFLDEGCFRSTLARAYQHHAAGLQTTQDLVKNGDASLLLETAQCLLVLALGAKILESRFDTDFNSHRLYYTSMQRLSQLHVAKQPLHDSLRGVQTMLLLVLCGFSFPHGLNAWYLVSTIISSCLDLGLQRRQLHSTAAGQQASDPAVHLENLRGAAFWSAYSLERSLSEGKTRASWNTMHSMFRMLLPLHEPFAKRRRTITSSGAGSTNYEPAVFSFRFDRIVAEVKLTLYRVANFPKRFPWPTDLESWQEKVHVACDTILNRAVATLNGQGFQRQDQIITSLTVKYHQCLMILYRPSPAISEPSPAALQWCYNSAAEIVRIHHEMARFATLVNSWLTAHAVFTSGITLLYCIWMSSDIRNTTSMNDLAKHGSSCTMVLDKLSKTWTVAGSAKAKFESLVQLTTENWKRGQPDAKNVRPKECPAPSSNNIVPPGDPLSFLTGMSEADGALASLWNDPIGSDLLPDPDIFIDELGDMSSWFDLEWLT